MAKSPTTRLANINYVDSVSVTGVVSKKDSKVIKSETPLVISKVLVSNGQEVAIGQPVITVDQIATTKKMIELKQNSSVSATSIDNTSYESAMALIPKEVISNEAGIIENVNFSDGQYVAANDVIASLNGSDGLIINSSISENYISKVKVGQPVIITGSGFSTKKYNGVVDSISNVEKKLRIQRVEHCLDMVGLLEKINVAAGDLSGGEKQRVCIARAIANNPDIILADEPCGNLDSENTENIMNILSELHRQGKTILLITHSMGEADKAERKIIMKDGKAGAENENQIML